MAATPTPLVWDYSRNVGAVDGLGGNVHYFDTTAQAVYLNDGIATQTTEVEEGHWDESDYSEEIVIDDAAYTLLTLDHPHTGILFFAATDGTNLYYLRYVYAMDLADLIKTGAWRTQIDNPIAQMSLQMMNASAAMFAGAGTLFNPGAKLALALRLGDGDPYQLGVAYIDEVDFDELATTVPISGRNATGFKLYDQTFDTTTSITGYAHEVAAAIFALAGITDYHIAEGTHSWTHMFKPDQTLLSGLQQLMEFYTGWQMVELEDGTFVMGYPVYVQYYQANSFYEFDAGSEVFKRKTNKSADAAYTNVYVTGVDSGGADLTPVYLPVNHYDFWALGSHRTCHITAPDGFSQSELADYAAQCAADLQYVGIGEDFTGPLRPQILVGDIAAVIEGENATSLGAITEITQHFGEKGYYTDFTLDSGGEATDVDGVVTSRMAALNGYNRKLRMVDFMRSIAGKRRWSR